METTNMFDNLRQDHPVKSNQAMKEEMLASGDVRHRCKEMTLTSIASYSRKCTS